MSSGLRALMKLAEDEKLEFPISLYSGQMFISGRVCARSWWVKVTKDAADADRDTALRFLGKKNQTGERARDV
ncbi:MAG TPA: hypothetical protein VGO60_04900, partial [Iamia sp.]|nr:hypothetical protein [Iamia sp.]